MQGTVIVDCPHCHTSNSTDGAEASEVTNTGVGTMVVCRGCGRHFHAPNQVNEVGSHTTQVVMPGSKAENARPTAVVTVADLRIPQELSDEATSVMHQHDGPTHVGAYPMPPEAYSNGTDPDHQMHDPTSVMQADALHSELRRMKERREEARTRSFIEQYPILEQWLRRAKLGRRIFLEQTPAMRAMVVAGAMVVLLLLVTILRMIFHGHGDGAFIGMAQPLLNEPAHGTRAQRAQGTVLRGAQVTVLDEVGPYVTVRDLQGRVGYVVRDSLVNERPASQPDTPFVDCMSAATEGDRRGCESRADEQWDSCRSWCEKGNGTEKCTDDCRGQYELCRATCRGEAVRPEPSTPPPPPPPRAQEAPRAPAPVESHGNRGGSGTPSKAKKGASSSSSPSTSKHKH